MSALRMVIHLHGGGSTPALPSAAPRTHTQWANRVSTSSVQSAHLTGAGTAGLGLDKESDESLMLAYAQGDVAAFERLVARHKAGLYNFILRSLGQRARAEEMLQEVFVRVVRAKERYATTARFSTWVYTIARNLCVDEARRRKFRDVVSLDAPMARSDGDARALVDNLSASQPSVEDQADAPALAQRMARAIAALPDEQREVFLLRQLAELGFKEIGEIVGTNENTVKSRMRYALEKIRQDLADLDPRHQSAEQTPSREAADHG